MKSSNERPSLRTIANNNANYLNNLKLNYSLRKDNIELIKAQRELSKQIANLSNLITKKEGTL